MRPREISPVVRLIFGSTVYLLVVGFAAAMLWGWTPVEATIALTCAGIATIGGGFIWCIVHSINHRDDAQQIDPHLPDVSNRRAP